MNSSVLFQSFHSLVKDDNRLNKSDLSYSMFVDKKSNSPITKNISIDRIKQKVKW